MPKKSKSKKQKELEERLPPARGEAAKEKVSAAHASAEKRHEMQREAKVRLAAQHNTRAASVVAEARQAHERAIDELKQSADASMSAHAARHDAEVQARKIKGTHEVEKVTTALAALQEATIEKAHRQESVMQAAQQRRAATLQQVKAKGHAESEKVTTAVAALQEATAEKAQKQVDAMNAAEARRAARLQTVAAKGHAETEKVDSAASKLSQQAEAKAAILEAASASAAERRAAKLGAIAAKGAAESQKVERVVGHTLNVSTATALAARGGGDSVSPPPLARQEGAGKMRPAPPSPDSVLWTSSAPEANLPALKPPTPLRPLEYGEAALLLMLMRAGAPNAEVLNASGADELAAIATKYGIQLEGTGSAGSAAAAVC